MADVSLLWSQTNIRQTSSECGNFLHCNTLSLKHIFDHEQLHSCLPGAITIFGNNVIVHGQKCVLKKVCYCKKNPAFRESLADVSLRLKQNLT